jgi:hypothetical protein
MICYMYSQCIAILGLTWLLVSRCLGLTTERYNTEKHIPQTLKADDCKAGQIIILNHIKAIERVASASAMQPRRLAVGTGGLGGRLEPLVQAGRMEALGTCAARHFWQLPIGRMHDAVADQAFLHTLQHVPIRGVSLVEMATLSGA